MSVAKLVASDEHLHLRTSFGKSFPFPEPILLIIGVVAMHPSPQDLIFQELSSFVATHELNLSMKELRSWSVRVMNRLNGQLISHIQAADLLGVCSDSLHNYRKSKLIMGIPKNPNAKRIHYVYELTDVLELKGYRKRLYEQREGVRS
jgi:hypothetical protein